jgi:hypothetical protein
VSRALSKSKSASLFFSHFSLFSHTSFFLTHKSTTIILNFQLYLSPTEQSPAQAEAELMAKPMLFQMPLISLDDMSHVIMRALKKNEVFCVFKAVPGLRPGPSTWKWSKNKPKPQ